ncbi:hypothetical protein ACWEOH_09910 [Agromyces sp. NPDC004153]
MAVIAPPRQPDSRDAESTVEPDRGGEALIEEAKQHAKLRRRRVAITTTVASAVVAGAATAALVAGGAGTSSSERSSSPAGAEIPAAADTAETEYVGLEASWAAPLPAYGNLVMIFSDGRVLRPGRGDVLREWWLTPAGLDLIRTGRVTAHDIYFDTSFDVQPDASTFPDDSSFDRRVAWADQSGREYIPTEFAVCADAGWIPATSVVDRLPDAVRDVVAGTQRKVPFAVFEQLEVSADWGTEIECFVLNAQDLATIAKFSTPETSRESVFVFKRLTFTVEPVLPDGSVVRWGG